MKYFLALLDYIAWNLLMKDQLGSLSYKQCVDQYHYLDEHKNDYQPNKS